MKKLKAEIKIMNEKAIEYATMDFDNVNDDVLTLKFKWTNKKTTIESFERYVKNYLRGFEYFKRAYKINKLELIEE